MLKEAATAAAAPAAWRCWRRCGWPRRSRADARAGGGAAVVVTTEAIALNIIRTDKAKRRMLERAAGIIADSFPG